MIFPDSVAVSAIFIEKKRVENRLWAKGVVFGKTKCIIRASFRQG